MLEEAFVRGRVASPGLPGATAETYIVDAAGQPLSSETAQVMPFPGCAVNIPVGSEVVVAYLAQGQDPLVIAGNASLAAMKAIAVLLASMPAGGLVIADPVVGTNGVKIGSTGIDLFGVVTQNGNPLP